MTGKMTLIKLKCEPLFEVDRIVATPAVMKAVDPDYAMACLACHVTGDWGLVDDTDREANDAALHNGSRIISVWPLPDAAAEFWILTEADRSVTTFLLPDEY